MIIYMSLWWATCCVPRYMLLIQPRINMETATGAVVAILAVVYVFLPLLFRYSKAFQRQLVFLPYDLLADGPKWRSVNYQQPGLLGLKGTRNFHLQTDADVRVGVWHVLPQSMLGKFINSYSSDLASGHPIVLYLHGNSGTRATRHRIEMYQLLQSLDYHVVTLDYRGFADSSPAVMSEEGAVHDATRVFRYIREFSGNSPLIVWGHSLGTALAIKMVAKLCMDNEPTPDRLVLESPFNNITNVFRTHPLTRMYRLLSFADRFFTERLERNSLSFDSELYIRHVDCPVLMLHARDDPIVSVYLCRKLYQTGLNQRPAKWPPLKLIEFDEELKCRHEYICRAPQLASIIREYVQSGRAERKYCIAG